MIYGGNMFGIIFQFCRFVKNCGDFLVYWLPAQTQGRTTYNVEVELCSADQYEGNHITIPSCQPSLT